MSIDRLNKKYGPNWSTSPPALAKAFVFDGAKDISDLKADADLTVVSEEPESDTISVIQRLDPMVLQISNDGLTVEIMNQVVLAGAWNFVLHEAGSLKETQGTQYQDNSGYYGAPADGENSPKEGLSLLIPVRLWNAPFIVGEGKGWTLDLVRLDPTKGQPIPPETQRYFACRVTGFTLYTR